ncbi:uncharacterized protein G2W53_041196 [Senna tora]|uniref:Uncharacterized protein n=1 Tax=Senna tora TaxID=362788 RepID=A0A834VYZ8_9FABA|nr:uncharacterized protein G2W53_041196 [Senna tora]
MVKAPSPNGLDTCTMSSCFRKMISACAPLNALVYGDIGHGELTFLQSSTNLDFSVQLRNDQRELKGNFPRVDKGDQSD